MADAYKNFGGSLSDLQSGFETNFFGRGIYEGGKLKGAGFFEEKYFRDIMNAILQAEREYAKESGVILDERNEAELDKVSKLADNAITAAKKKTVEAAKNTKPLVTKASIEVDDEDINKKLESASSG